MQQLIAQLQSYTLIRTLFYIVVGTLIFITPATVFYGLVYLSAGYLVLKGVSKLLQGRSQQKTYPASSNDLIPGMMSLLFALIIVLFAKSLVSFIPIILGVLVFFNGLLHFSSRSQLRTREVNPRYQIGAYAYSGLLIITGLVIIFNPFKSVLLVFRIIGGALIFMGVSELVTHLWQRRSTHSL